MTRVDSTTPQAVRLGLTRDRLLDPIHLVVIPSLVVLVVAHHYGMTAAVPLWAILGSFLLAQFSATAFAAVWPPGTSRAKPRLFLVVTIGSGGLFLYVTGWGAILAVMFVAAAAVVIQTDGSRYGSTAALVATGTIAVGECAIALGAFSSVVSEPTGHVLAVVEAAITAIVISLVTRGQREKERAELREADGDERFRALVQYASDAILVLGRDGAVSYASPAAARVLGCPPEELERFDISWIDPDHVDALLELFTRLGAEPGAVASADVPIRRPDGTSRWVEVHFTNLSEDPAVGGFVCNVRDIGERRVAQQQLVHDAQHDPVTHLPNRRFFVERLDQACTVATPDDLLAVLFIDLDHFKQINDRLGHAVGDLVLQAVAGSLSTLVRPPDVAARYGGDEFTVLLEGLTDVAGALEIAERITTGLSRSWRIADHDIAVSVSVGVSTCPGRGWDSSELLRQADAAMYRAKRRGRACWESIDRAAAFTQ